MSTISTWTASWSDFHPGARLHFALHGLSLRLPLFAAVFVFNAALHGELTLRGSVWLCVLTACVQLVASHIASLIVLPANTSLVSALDSVVASTRQLVPAAQAPALEPLVVAAKLLRAQATHAARERATMLAAGDSGGHAVAGLELTTPDGAVVRGLL